MDRFCAALGILPRDCCLLNLTICVTMLSSLWANTLLSRTLTSAALFFAIILPSRHDTDV